MYHTACWYTTMVVNRILLGVMQPVGEMIIIIIIIFFLMSVIKGKQLWCFICLSG